MTTVTIHADDEFAIALRAYAARLGKSVNQTVKDYLAPILGLYHDESMEKRVNPWKRFCGCIPKDEADALRAVVAEQHVIDEEMWR